MYLVSLSIQCKHHENRDVVYHFLALSPALRMISAMCIFSKYLLNDQTNEKSGYSTLIYHGK